MDKEVKERFEEVDDVLSELEDTCKGDVGNRVTEARIELDKIRKVFEGTFIRSFVHNGDKRPGEKGMYEVIYSDKTFGQQYWDGHSWKTPRPVVYWKSNSIKK